MLITGDDSNYVAFVMGRLSEQFHMSDLGPLSYFLEIEVTSTPDDYYLIESTFMTLIVSVSLITVLWTLLWSFTLVFVQQTVSLLGIPLATITSSVALYLGITHPNISYVVHILSQFMSTLTNVHYGHLLHVLRYLRGTMDRRLFFSSSSSLQLHAYSDTTWF
jgi:hypothetical protein